VGEFKVSICRLTGHLLKHIFDSIWLEDLGFECQEGPEIFSFPKCPDKLWGLPSHLFIEYQGSFSGVKLTTHLYLVLKLKMSKTICLPLYAFMACIMTNLLYSLHVRNHRDLLQKYSVHEISFFLILDWRTRVQFPVRCTGIFLYITTSE
jgi:hypothetical protein